MGWIEFEYDSAENFLINLNFENFISMHLNLNLNFWFWIFENDEFKFEFQIFINDELDFEFKAAKIFEFLWRMLLQ